MFLTQIPAPVSPFVCVSCLSDEVRWVGSWPTRVDSMCFEHWQEWKAEKSA
jgi:hypothetical protein